MTYPNVANGDWYERPLLGQVVHVARVELKEKNTMRSYDSQRVEINKKYNNLDYFVIIHRFRCQINTVLCELPSVVLYVHFKLSPLG